MSDNDNPETTLTLTGFSPTDDACMFCGTTQQLDLINFDPFEIVVSAPQLSDRPFAGFTSTGQEVLICSNCLKKDETTLGRNFTLYFVGGVIRSLRQSHPGETWDDQAIQRIINYLHPLCTLAAKKSFSGRRKAYNSTTRGN